MMRSCKRPPRGGRRCVWGWETFGTAQVQMRRDALTGVGKFRYTRKVEARYPSGKGEVCKTFMREFDSHPRLQQNPK